MNNEENNEMNEENQPEEDVVENEASEAVEESTTPSAEDELADVKDKLLRSIAESENLRRRSERQVSEAAQYAVTSFARDLLSVSDNLRRTLDSIPEEVRGEETVKAFIEGLEMTERELLNVFEKQGITKITPVGEKFDHNFHQAMFEAESADAENGTILQVIQPGYVLKERLLRPAMVGVVKNSNKPNEVDESA